MYQDIEPLLQNGFKKLSLSLSQEMQNKFINYILLLNKWNKIHNLTSITTFKDIVIRHIFDSLSIIPFIIGPNIIDFGTGAGFPGIPLSICLPEYSFVLIDSLSKKTTFLNYVKITLNIENIEVINKRIENFYPNMMFNTIVTRAVAKTADIIDKTQHLYNKENQILIMKGKNLENEATFMNNKIILYKINVPYLREVRHLLKISKYKK